MRGVALEASITRRLAHSGVAFDETGVAPLAGYLELLATWNRRINLTSFPLDPPTDAAIDRLIVEPVAAARHVRAEDRFALDVGSGGGSPALPLKIAAPQLHMTLVEARARKSAFLREAVRVLGFADVDVVTARFEPGWTGVSPGTLDLVTLRAVRMDSALGFALAHLLKPGGRLYWFRRLVEHHNTSTSASDLRPFHIVNSDATCAVLQRQ